MLCHARSLFVLVLLSLFLVVPPAAAQSAQSVIEEIRARYQEQMETVDNYVIETDAYTSYHRKITEGGDPRYETTTRMNDEVPAFDAVGSTPATTSALPADLDRFAEHATYDGTESIDGRESHVLRIDNPAAVYDEMDSGAESMIYYVDTERFVPTRMMIKMQSQETDGPSPSSVTINLRDYRTEQGLTIPYETELSMDMNISEEQQRQMEQLKEKMAEMSERQRDQMKSMMGDKFEKMQDMMAGEPMTTTVRSVKVNEGIPEGIFEDDDQ
ncbi:MAG: hypothetical protein ACLFTE_05545 [Salinivenus sp.]